MAQITHLTSLSQLNSALSKSKDKPSVIDFHAAWCGPCHQVAPIFESLAKQYGKQVNFYKCDVDACRDVASLYRVSAMPTFIFLRGSDKIDQIRGADPRGLEAKIRSLASGSFSSSSSGSFIGSGRTLGSGKAVSGDLTAELKAKAGAGVGKVANLDPQLRVLLGIIGAYLVFWYLSF